MTFKAMSETEFKDKFIGFVDILGFKKIVEASEAGTGFPPSEVQKMLQKLGTPEEREAYQKYGPTTCPDSKCIQRNLDFRLTQVSDCVIVSIEVSPAGVINLVNHCWGAVIRLMTDGIMCRGYITRGPIYHTDENFFGTGYQKAHVKESDSITAFKREADEKGTPFVEVDPVVCEYVQNHTDPCVNKMFSRYVKGDGAVTALFPFKRLSHSFIVAGWPGHKFDPEKERESNNNMRLMLKRTKKNVLALVDRENPDAIRKAEHYIAALDAQLEMCKKTDEAIDMLGGAL
jgi:hypothetical protein